MEKIESVKRIVEGHPTYLPDSDLAQRAEKALVKLPQDVLIYLSLMVSVDSAILGEARKKK